MRLREAPADDSGTNIVVCDEFDFDFKAIVEFAREHGARFFNELDEVFQVEFPNREWNALPTKQLWCAVFSATLDSECKGNRRCRRCQCPEPWVWNGEGYPSCPGCGALVVKPPREINV